MESPSVPDHRYFWACVCLAACAVPLWGALLLHWGARVTPQEIVQAAWPWVVGLSFSFAFMLWFVGKTERDIKAKMREEQARGESAVVLGLRADLRRRDYFVGLLIPAVNPNTLAQIERQVEAQFAKKEEPPQIAATPPTTSPGDQS